MTASSARLTFESARQLLQRIPNAAYNNSDAAPYYASVGGHIRHILNVFVSILRAIELKQVNLADRLRDKQVETDPQAALHALDRIDREINSLGSLPSDLKLSVIDDLGQGFIEMPYTLAALLYQAQSHAIHHFACISYILSHQDILIPIDAFGYNPTFRRCH